MDRFPVTRIISLPDGRSAFYDDAIELVPAGDIGIMGTPIPARDIILRTNAPDYEYDWHVAPDRQFILMLTGEKRRFKPGEILVTEDTEGQGHKTRNVGGTWRNSAFVRLQDIDPFDRD